MTDLAADRAAAFLELHHRDRPFVIANAWDPGSARLLASLGFEALATTSSGFAATLGRLDYGVTRAEALGHAAALVAAVDVPVSADLENCFADDPAGVADTVRAAVETGLAGCSIEDFTGAPDDPIYDAGLARERVAAAAEAAHAGGGSFVLTARCENFLHRRTDIDDTVSRLVSYADAGADVVFAPGVQTTDGIRAITEAVGRPVNVLALPGTPSVAELADLGVRRVSVGGALAFAALGAVAEAGRELLDHGTYGYWQLAGAGSKAAKAAFRR